MMILRASKPNLFIFLIQEDYGAVKLDREMDEALVALRNDPAGHDWPDPGIISPWSTSGQKALFNILRREMVLAERVRFLIQAPMPHLL